MKRLLMLMGAFALATVCWTGCFPDDYLDERPVVKPEKPEPEPEPEPDPEPDPDPKPEDDLSYENLAAYDCLKNYVNRQTSPDFKMGGGITVSEYLRQGKEYEVAVANLNEMTAGNAMKQSSVMRRDGTMDFTQVRNFIELAERSGMTVYGHTLAWHAQQQNHYLNEVLKGKKVEVPSGTGSEVILDADFNDGQNPFNGWGNESTREVKDGVLKVTNPSSVESWKAQIAYDVATPFENGLEYKMNFRIKGSSAGHISSGLQITDGYKSAGEFPTVNFDTQWKDVEIKCSCNAAGATRLIFSFGEFAGDIYIDDFVLTATGVSYTFEPLTPEEKKEVLTEVLDKWIKGMMEVTATRVSAWDAVNEPISGRDTNGDGFYELESAAWGSANNFYWQDYLGSGDYIRIVIAKARKYYAEYGGTAPLRLFINDYNLESDWEDNK